MPLKSLSLALHVVAFVSFLHLLETMPFLVSEMDAVEQMYRVEADRLAGTQVMLGSSVHHGRPARRDRRPWPQPRNISEPLSSSGPWGAGGPGDSRASERSGAPGKLSARVRSHAAPSQEAIAKLGLAGKGLLRT